MSYPEEQIREWLLRTNLPKIKADMPTFMRRPLATSKDDLDGADVVIIGSPYVASWGPYADVAKEEWIAATRRVRQQSARYESGYIQEFYMDVFDHLRVVDYGDAAIPLEVYDNPTVSNILAAQQAVEDKVNDALDAGAKPIVIGQNSPCGSYAIVKPVAERATGNVGVISTDVHWDSMTIDQLTMDPRIAGAACWKYKMFEFHDNILHKNLVEIGERGMAGAGPREVVKMYLDKGTHFYPMWKVREKGIKWLCNELHHAYEDTESVYVHFDMDVLGGAGPAPGDLLGGLAEPMGMTDYEIIRLAYEIGKKGFDAFSFICIAPGSAVNYRVVVYIIMYAMAGMIYSKNKLG